MAFSKEILSLAFGPMCFRSLICSRSRAATTVYCRWQFESLDAGTTHPYFKPVLLLCFVSHYPYHHNPRRLWVLRKAVAISKLNVFPFHIRCSRVWHLKVCRERSWVRYVLIPSREVGACQQALFEWADSFDTKDWDRLRRCIAPTLLVRDFPYTYPAFLPLFLMNDAL